MQRAAAREAADHYFAQRALNAEEGLLRDAARRDERLEDLWYPSAGVARISTRPGTAVAPLSKRSTCCDIEAPAMCFRALPQEPATASTSPSQSRSARTKWQEPSKVNL